MVLLGFVNGAKLFLGRFSVTLRKFTSSRFASIVTFRPFSSKILQRLFFILSTFMNKYSCN